MTATPAAAPLTLFQFPPALGLPISESPPCAKVEVYCRLTQTPYTLELGDTRMSPNKMVPFVRWPDGTLQGESGDIIDQIEQHAGLDEGLDVERLEAGRALAARVEDVVYDACLYDRFVVSEGWLLQRALTRRLLARLIPGLLVPLATVVVRRQQVRRARRGEMADAEKGYASAVSIIERVAELLGDDPYLCGERPSTVDCAVWPNLVHVAATPNGSPARAAVWRDLRLQAWMLRLGERAGLPLDPTAFRE